LFRKYFQFGALFLLFVCTSLAQVRFKPPPPVLISSYQFPVDSIYSDLFVAFRIPYGKLVFVKENKNYSASFEFGIDVKRNDTLVERTSVSENVVLQNYDLTKSKDDYVQGLVKFKLKSGKYNLIPEIRLKNTNIDVRLKPIAENIVPDTVIIFEPLVVNKHDNEFVLTNYENNFPFSAADYGILIPVKNSVDTVSVKIQQGDYVICDTTLTDKIKHRLFPDARQNEIMLKTDTANTKLNYFYLNDFSHLLNEGMVEIKIKAGKMKKVMFKKQVVWYSKPIILYNPEKAVSLLRIIGEEKEAKAIFKHPSKLYYKKLIEYWNRKFPQKSKFNEAMNEFYTRADYALLNFRTLGKANGLRTDRAVVYIKYGKPSSIERKYSEQNEILEIWRYQHLNREFIFIDRTGSGNFKLLGK